MSLITYFSLVDCTISACVLSQTSLDMGVERHDISKLGCLRTWLSVTTISLLMMFRSVVFKNSFIYVSRINITTFFNLPDMFRRYTRHLQCYIFWNRRWIQVVRDVTKFVTLRWQYCELKSLKLMTLNYLQGESQVYVFHLLVEVGFLPFYDWLIDWLIDR